MTKSTKAKKQEQVEQDEAAIIERMDEALKRMLSTPPETHKEMIERRRKGAAAPTAPKRKGKR